MLLEIRPVRLTKRFVCFVYHDAQILPASYVPALHHLPEQKPNREPLSRSGRVEECEFVNLGLAAHIWRL